MDMNERGFTLLKHAGKLSRSGQQGAIGIGKDNRFNPLLACLGSQFTVVEENEQGTYPSGPKSAHESEHMAFNSAEQFANRAYRKPLGDFGYSFARRTGIVPMIPPFIMNQSIIGYGRI
jgi:hypothetical protein